MSKIVIRTGFHPEVKREYRGEHIYPIIGERTLPAKVKNAAPSRFYQIANLVWIKDLGDDKYVSDWSSEERWGLVEEVISGDDGREEVKTLGFMILRVDRKNGLL